MTPHAFVLDRRIERATELLARPDHSLLDVAQLTGFPDAAAFLAACSGSASGSRLVLSRHAGLRGTAGQSYPTPGA